MDNVLLRVVVDVGGRDAPFVARHPVGCAEAVVPLVGVVSSDEPHVVETGNEGSRRCRESDDEFVLRASILVDGQFGGYGVFNVEESVLGTLHVGGYGDVGYLHAVHRQRPLSSLVGCGEAQHDGEAVLYTLLVIKRVLYIAVGLCVAVGFAVVVALRGVRRVVVLMASLALLFAWCHEVERALLQLLGGALVGCHRAVAEVLLCLLIPVAHVAVVVNLVEGL